MDKTINLQFDKETLNTFRYKEIVPPNEKPVIVTLYVKKEALGEEKPEKLIVTIKSE